MGARGRRISDRYHELILRTPTEARNALRYVIGNRAIHLERWDRSVVAALAGAFSSTAATELVKMPASWLLRVGWTRAGPITESAHTPPVPA